MRRRLAVAAAGLLALAITPGVVSAEGLTGSRGTPTTSSAPVVPDGFSDTVVGHVNLPTAVAWTPDGRMLVASKPGSLVVVDEEAGNDVAINLSARICSEGELGLVGLAVDPAFTTNHFVYLYYTDTGGGTCSAEGGPKLHNRVGRFVLQADNEIDPASEKVIVDNIRSPRAHHIAGDLEFGRDGYLYISVGDGVCTFGAKPRCGPLNTNAQARNLPNGKILRVTRTGLPPKENPYAGAANARRCTKPGPLPAGAGPCKEIFASGFRNPFRFARKPGTNAFFVNDVGLHTWEEIDRLVKGKNYGWSVREGHCARDSTTKCGEVAPYVNPIFDYPHTKECRSITGGAFVPKGLWPGFDGAYLFADYACGKIWRLDKTAGGDFKRKLLLSGAEGPTHLRFGPHGDSRALYYLSIFDGTVHRVTTTSENTAPTAEFDYTPDGTHVSFDGSASEDGDGGDQVETWSWDFGDGTSATRSTPTVQHTYAAAQEYDVTLTVTDSHGLDSAPVTRTVYSGEHPPSVAITGPDPAARFAVGDSVTLSATASDAEDGALPGSAISWTVRRQHANHFHPYLDDIHGASVKVGYPEPEELAAARDSWLVAYATATDSHGLTTTVSQKLLPHKVRLTFVTRPEGGFVVLEGMKRIAPAKVVSWEGHVFPIRVKDQTIDGKAYVFARWSDGKARVHDIVTPAVRTRYVARLRRK